jgi:hypothetical protein
MIDEALISQCSKAVPLRSRDLVVAARPDLQL